MSKQQQVRNAGIYMVPSFVSMLLPIISLPIILKYLNPSEFGAYTMSLAFGSIVISFCQLSLFGVFERNFFYTLMMEKEKNYYSQLFLLFLLSC